MAAVSDAPVPRVLELRQVRASALQALLEEETEAWRAQLDWDFLPSADLVRRFVEMQALSGHCLMLGSRVIGYTYYVCEDRKGLIGDLYVIEEFRTPENETLLLSATLEALMKAPFVRRIESQLMMLGAPLDRPLPSWRWLQVHSRQFMEADLLAAAQLPARETPEFLYQVWNERAQEEAAHLIPAAYRGHIDSQINDQYRSISGARRFLLNIVQYPGCGSFFQAGSYVALHSQTGRICGLCLTSLVAPTVGHITQLCIEPSVKGYGVGYELLRRSLVALAAQGCEKVSLTVTAANAEAIRLYERMEFSTVRRFAAYVWEGF
ncbi:MAG: GNAT family N-acetyltransferase [Bryobacteraceae bacterium]